MPPPAVPIGQSAVPSVPSVPSVPNLPGDQPELTPVTPAMPATPAMSTGPTGPTGLGEQAALTALPLLPQDEPPLLNLDTSNTAPLEVEPTDPSATVSTVDDDRTFPDLSFPLGEPAVPAMPAMPAVPAVPPTPQGLQPTPSKSDKELLE